MHVNQATVIAVAVILNVLAIAIVGMRVWQRAKSDKAGTLLASVYFGSHLDDLFALLALPLVTATSVTIIWGAAVGSVGTHSSPDDIGTWITTVTPDWVNLSKVVWIVLWLQPVALGFIKLSVLFFYRRIISVSTTFNIISWVMIAITIGWMIAFFFGLFFDCGANISDNWGSLANIGENCPFGFLPTIIYTILEACLDLFVLVLPIPWVFRLQMPMSRKLAVVACLMLGGFATAAALVRMTIFIETGVPAAALNRTSVLGLPTYDVVGIVSAEMFWTVIETNVALISICLPSLRSFLGLAISSNWIRLSSLGRFYRSYVYSRGTTQNTSRTGFSTMGDKDVEMGRGLSTNSSKMGVNMKHDIEIESKHMDHTNSPTNSGGFVHGSREKWVDTRITSSRQGSRNESRQGSRQDVTCMDCGSSHVE